MREKTTIIFFSCDYDKAIAAYIIANDAMAYDHEVKAGLIQEGLTGFF